MPVRRSAALTALTAAAVVGTAVPALAHDTGAHAPRVALAAVAETGTGVGMTAVANLPHRLFTETDAPNGSDVEFLTLGGRDYALAGTLRNGLQVVDVTDPTRPVRTAVYDCSITQGDVQVFRQGGRVLATYTADAAIAPRQNDGTRTAVNQRRFEAACVTEANALGAQIDGSELGTFLVDLTDPARPRTAGFLEVPQGSHNQTVHPSGDYLYNSNSDLLGVGGLPEITIHDISDPARPRKVQDFTFPPVPTSLGTESHDIFFNADGTRAYAAALSSTLVLDTSDPEAPRVISQVVDPSINVVHQSDLVRLPRKDGTVRDLLVVTDEQAGAAANPSCPGGGLHVFDVTGDLERRTDLSNKVGAWFIRSTANPTGGVCTSHVLRLHPDQAMLTIAWYTQGVRVLDISGLAEAPLSRTAVALGEGIGIKEVGSYVFPDADTWSFKTNRIARDGSFFGYGNDLARGLDVYRFEPGRLVGGRSVPALAPEDLAAPGCTGVPIATVLADRADARDVHRRAVDCVLARGVARGSVRDGARVFLPLADVTRGQMATFLVGALRAAGVDHELYTAPARDVAFTDTAGSVHRPAIELLARLGIVQGRTATTYAPDAVVTREQMASFVVRAAQFAVEPDLARTGRTSFADVDPRGVHAASILVGADNDLFQGTTARTFTPKALVKRDQMASFLTRFLDVVGRGNATPRAGTSTG
ncbi:MAG TPA: S-layer homology domain-containing protein [Mycobacteriales bacterium]|nr:S-layer homology domain-containing protein [Mycobacteriales bacterium]